ncbi:hypothetical protein G5I_14047 [Acromyrmex echinatior]|uniref:Uncharacterized protein n=1 Tax=Acromyrmex echinatior TaxID=103372 RepID=F4X6S8_ACREC|nr:hypothetical protein G5I_14047 [Acromyrmex echinatior]
MHLVDSSANQLEGTMHSPWNFICCERSGINSEANEQSGMSMPSLKDRDPSGQDLTNPTQVVGKRNSWPPSRMLITGEYCFPFRTHELQLQCVLKEAAGNRPTANQHVDDAFVPAHH